MRRALQQTMERENPALWPMTEERTLALPEFFANCVQDPDVRVLVASTEGKIVATITGRVGQGRDVAAFGLVDDAWVDPEHRGRGLCRLLLSTLIEFFRERDLSKLQLGYIHGGEAGAVWQRLGFSPVVVTANAALTALVACAGRVE
jgi:GNAT superfamily N-acetyltransferase